MSTSFVSKLAGRLTSVDWVGDWERSRSRVRLMHEFLRRSALWAHALGSDDWPFFDVAALVEPSVRADELTVEQVVAGASALQPVVGDTCAWALHLAALRDADVRLPELPDPFEPLVRMYERGGAFLLDGTGFVQVDAAAVPLMTCDQRFAQPELPMTDADLDALDGH
ncbi:hypothetical protein ACH4NF_14665 [Streptomyces sp. NPDC017248]|uniref:hypothetical protein n=1 Tax=unclassified Streptomyces TaxID=2593676 RepID=UPI0037A01D77